MRDLSHPHFHHIRVFDNKGSISVEESKFKRSYENEGDYAYAKFGWCIFYVLNGGT